VADRLRGLTWLTIATRHQLSERQCRQIFRQRQQSQPSLAELDPLELVQEAAEEWEASYPEAKGLKRSTRRGYSMILSLHLVPAFGRLDQLEIDVARVESYLAAKRKAGLSPASLNRQLNVLSLVLKAALRRGLVRANPIPLVERPREPSGDGEFSAPPKSPRASVRGARYQSWERSGATGRPFDVLKYTTVLRTALAGAGIDGYVCPCHDLRHSSITNAAAAGVAPEALIARSGHSSYSTTRRYVDLAGERFREEAELLEQRLWSRSGTKNRYHTAQVSPSPAEDRMTKPVAEAACVQELWSQRSGAGVEPTQPGAARPHRF
jgi:hypothetical protein